ncbi:hypothetical protein MAPG_11483 [Magnaporthiopsis poae ATCC 64411]|uniref:Uncharacterized protein n=1 Tax=Magnaporthiopsis poae (strain ATCC 64411 / 73-15) TaxID=644358 RepID=A0A0C4EFE0_MAGP6|nr:hypothetical protein MAPG_11483 [Magnaporthiopsis poae ATCC 64411]
MAPLHRHPYAESPAQEVVSAQPSRVGENAAGTSYPSSRGGTVFADGDASVGAPSVSVAGVREKKPWLKRLAARLGLDLLTLKLMLKGSLPPIIAISMLQSRAATDYFSSIGYEVSIVSVLAVAILPRGKYLQTLVLNLTAVIAGTGLAMLVLWLGVQARLNTSTLPPQTTTSNTTTGRPQRLPYNGPQSAVCAVWLFFSIWLVNLVRAKAPSFNIPTILFSILLNIACMNGPQLGSTAAAWLLVRRLLTSMLTALAIASAVSLLVFPVSSRGVVVRQLGAGVGLLRKAVRLQGEYLRGLENVDMFALHTVETSVGGGIVRAGGGTGTAIQSDTDDGGEDQSEERRSWMGLRRRRRKTRRKLKKTQKRAERTGSRDDKTGMEREQAVALDLKGTVLQLRGLSGKLQSDIGFAKNEVGWGKLSARDLGEVFKYFRAIFIPVMGMATIMDVFRRTAERRGWIPEDDEETPAEVMEEKWEERRLWNGLMRELHEPFAILSEAIDQGLEHAALQLEIVRRPKVSKKRAGVAAPSASGDVEARGGETAPGEAEFSRSIEEKLQRFYKRKGNTIRYWAKERGLSSDPNGAGSRPGTANMDFRWRSQGQLYVLLYLEQLMQATGEAVHELVLFADGKVADGTMSSKRLLIPGLHQMRKWASSVLGRRGEQSRDPSAQESSDVMDQGGIVVHLGPGFARRRDLEHLPPESTWERLGDGVRALSALLSSEASAFGMRVAFATMTVAVVGFVETTQVFFQQHRLVWAMIVIAMGMTQTSGQSIFGFLCRVGGTIIAMLSSFVIWYMVGEHPAGVIVMMWLFTFVDYYFFLKYPRFVPATMLVIFTQVLIIGYELQVGVIGIRASEALGTIYYPTHLLAPYRVAVVAGGCLVAFFWTVFPSPLTDRTWLRRDLSATLYLLANYFSAISQTIRVQLDEEEAQQQQQQLEKDTEQPPPLPEVASPAHHLAKVRHKIFGKLMLLLPSLESHSNWQNWEPTIGGRFPREVYDDILLRSNRILNYLTLMSYTATRSPHSGPFASSPPSPADERWVRTLRAVLDEVQPAHHQIVSTLALLSNALLSGQSLPPFIRMPSLYGVLNPRLPGGRRAGGGGCLHHSHPGRPCPWASPFSSSSGAGSDDDGDGGDVGENLADMLDPRNVEQRGYTEFAIMQVCSTLVRDDLQALVRAVERLVGVVDFSYRVDIGAGDTAGRAEAADRGDEKENSTGQLRQQQQGGGRRRAVRRRKRRGTNVSTAVDDSGSSSSSDMDSIRQQRPPRVSAGRG